MEHRWWERQPVDLAAFIYHQGYGGVPGTIRNVSMDGLFVQSDKENIASKGTLLEVKFTLTINGKKQPICLPALVIHQSRGGAGLMLLRPLNLELYQSILAPSRQRGMLAA